MRCWRYSRNWANNRHITRSFVAALCLFFPASAWSDDGLRIVTGDKLRLGGATYCPIQGSNAGGRTDVRSIAPASRRWR